MKKILLCLISTLLFCVSIYSQKTPIENFVGVFQDCFIHCGTYYINSDFTFKHKFSRQLTYGTWKYAGKNKIRLYAPGKKAETAILTGKNDQGETVKFELRIPKIKAFKKVLFFENDSICAFFNKGKSKSCYQRIETEQQSN